MTVAEQELIFRDDMTVTLVKASASDSDVVWSARVSTEGSRSLEALEADPASSEGLIRFLIRNRHSTPLEHSVFTFYIETPIFVVRELERHRIASYSEESGRYKELRPIFYVPGPDRKLVQIGKTGHYQFEEGSYLQKEVVPADIRRISKECYRAYERLLSIGVAKEVSRMVLPVNIYTSLYMTVNARSLMNVLSLRTNHPEAAYPSKPMREIEMVAEKMEAIFAEQMPITYQAFVDNGRVSP